MLWLFSELPSPTWAFNQCSITALNVDKCHDPQLQRPYISLKENCQHCHVPSSPKRNLCIWTSVPLSGAHKVHYLAGISNRHRSPCHFSEILELNDQRVYGFGYERAPFRHGQGMLFQTGALLWNFIIHDDHTSPFQCSRGMLSHWISKPNSMWIPVGHIPIV